MCEATALNDGVAKTCVREFPGVHREHVSSDGFWWKPVRAWEPNTKEADMPIEIIGWTYWHTAGESSREEES